MSDVAKPVYAGADERGGRAGMWNGRGRDLVVVAIIGMVTFTMPLWLVELGGYEALATKIVIWAIFALGFDLLLGFTGLLSFGHAAFFGTAAYITGLSLKHFSSDVIPAMAFAFVGTLLVALFIGFLTLRRTGIYFSILTLAFAEMIHALVLSSTLQRWTGGDNGLTGLHYPTLLGMNLRGIAVFYFCAVILVIMFLVAQFLKRSPFGLMLRSIKENPMRLEYTGINVWAYKMMAFLISAMYAGLAGSLMVIYEPYVATKFLHWSTSGEVVIATVIGGASTLIGPMIGAAFLMYFENVVQGMIGEQWRLILGLIFAAIVIFLPGGLIDIWRVVWRATGHKLLHGRRHNVPDMELTEPRHTDPRP
ncbi:branched-chain amino acid ABC transporter permease [Lutibaculum baratangense]|uniref:Branched-chain amino acid transport system permease protein LivM n=1 Tax=Lutibaculum baratangense AMV1 TaxID=631454 RepID=V4RJ17_9HYPH|nr:branched-chain amino acid ABC transporter permease [Lutibaculum baratangense]ESR25314.1 Branched-chain amino acid transport system permease protein LivM [Lutibaculum baratangense AMV1]